MFVFSMKTTRPRMAAYGLVLVLLVAVMAIGGGRKTAPVSAGGDDAKRVAYLQAQGYAVDPRWVDVRELTASGATVPTAYHGKRVKCFTYAAEGGDMVCLYEYNGKIIGSHEVAEEG